MTALLIIGWFAVLILSYCIGVYLLGKSGLL